MKNNPLNIGIKTIVTACNQSFGVMWLIVVVRMNSIAHTPIKNRTLPKHKKLKTAIFLIIV